MSDVAKLKFTILGCSSSPGVPRIHGDWGDCNPNNPKTDGCAPHCWSNELVMKATTNVVIDTGPDFREQMLAANVTHIDGVLYTHPHADHTHGIDDLRGYVLAQKHRVRTYSDKATYEQLNKSFGYCFASPEGSNYPPILKHSIIEPREINEINGAGGPIAFMPIQQVHGPIHSLGYRFGKFEDGKPKTGGFCYSSDVSDISQASTELMQNLDIWVVDALMYREHVSHFNLKQSLQWIDRLQPKQAVLTHMHTPMDYDAVLAETPEHVQPAYDGLSIELELLE